MHFEITTISNKKYDLNPNDFSPFQKPFAFQRFYQIFPKNIKLLNKDVSGAPLDRKIFENLKVDNLWEFRQAINSVNKDNILKFIDQYGVNIYDSTFDIKFDKFINIYFKNLNDFIEKNRNRNKHFLLPISHILARSKNSFKYDEKITKLKIILINSYIDDKQLYILKKNEIKNYNFK